jgi:Zn-dependent M28 family amino/carboxypeptidase
VPLSDSVLFVATGAEEQGSLGSLHLAQRWSEEGAEVRGVMAPDMIGYWPLGDGDAVDILGDEDSEHLVTSVGDLADRLGLAHKRWIDHGYCYGDDHTNFQEGGFPAVSAMDCVEAHNIAPSGEQTPHYHRTTDRIDTLHLGFTARVAGLLVATMATWAQPVP